MAARGRIEETMPGAPSASSPNLEASGALDSSRRAPKAQRARGGEMG